MSRTVAIALSALSSKIFAPLEATARILQHPIFVLPGVSLTVDQYLALNVFQALIALPDHLIHLYVQMG